ncbi:MAG: HAMP domain-containing histidine kinase [Mesorhizobium sp.]|nr:MAG: HAMP domain-containing histidine kinase [Mesorhizobium sp.]
MSPVQTGMSQQELDNLQEILTTSFAWGTLVVAGLALTGGVWLAIRAQRRFNAVSRPMNAVSHGKLSARIPLIGRGDDIDILSRDINGALARLEGTVEGMRQISADIAHDLKTPLNRLRMTVDDAIEKQQRGEPVADDLMEAAEEVERINATFEALLRISQIEAGSRRARFGAVKFDPVLSSLVDIYHDVAADEGQSLRLGMHPGPLPELSGDRELLTQMFANLIEDATGIVRATRPSMLA